ncbi:macrophage mannose receptor 1-like [Labrus mixtus]|uniref:macrophage mannose receptor 1-like n=1 Tax=Labrus mixtus TaxID=508554 RepID=UPI0029BFFAC7|nr:macrophage mannose receptor 1-like [Labrus mixtus]XP_060887403.1 macrophage mannose receptor 1-like [Labrus mixtus]
MAWLHWTIPLIGLLFLFQRTTQLTSQQYHLIKSHRSWYDAQRFCRVKYTDLATVGNMDDNDELLTALGHDWTYSWIGLQKGGARRWMWSDGSGPASFYKWHDGEPSGDEWCVEISEKGGWNDLSCADTKGCVCYERQINGDKRYVYRSDARSWAYSLELCRSEHTDMAYINSEQDMADVIQTIKTWYGSIILEKKVWIGLFSDAWMWADGSQTSFRNWLAYKPDRENCAAVSVRYKGRWVDAQCNQENTFVCQGGLKVKKMVMRMMVRSDLNLTDSKIRDALLKELEARLRLRSVDDFILSWRSDRHGQVFQYYEELKEEVAETGC